METQKHRPLGVTIIAILTIIGGIFLIAGGVGLIALGAFVSIGSTTTNSAASNPHIASQAFGIIFALIGSVLLAIGIGYIIMFYGLLKGKGWSWTITVILLIIGIAIQIISTITGGVFNASVISNNNTNSLISGIIGGIIGIAINSVVVYYLYRPHVKEYFGKAESK
jgi:hypothetical protein